MRRSVEILTWPLVAFGTVVEFAMLVLGYVILRAHCLIGWHAWAWESRLRVPFYGIGAWKCIWCSKVKVRPCP